GDALALLGDDLGGLRQGGGEAADRGIAAGDRLDQHREVGGDRLQVCTARVDGGQCLLPTRQGLAQQRPVASEGVGGAAQQVADVVAARGGLVERADQVVDGSGDLVDSGRAAGAGGVDVVTVG